MVVTSLPSACTASTLQLFTVCAVQLHGAGAAVAGVAADRRADLADAFPQVVHEEQPRLDLVLALLPVDGHV